MAQFNEDKIENIAPKHELTSRYDQVHVLGPTAGNAKLKHRLLETWKSAITIKAKCLALISTVFDYRIHKIQTRRRHMYNTTENRLIFAVEGS